MKKIVTIAGKKYVIDVDTKQMEEVEAEDEVVETTEEATEDVVEETTETVEETVEETPAESEEKIDQVAEETAQKMLKTLGIENLRNEVKQLSKTVNNKNNQKVASLINLEKLMKKDVTQMTAKEKIVGFFQGMLQNDHSVLKALSEGIAADGGYLFPDEFRAEIIRDIAETPHMRQEVTVIPMKRDIMNIPTLISGPKVTWTDENSVKSTTTARFGQKTLTVKKMAAINAKKGSTILKNIVKIPVNSWNPLTFKSRAIMSQAFV